MALYNDLNKVAIHGAVATICGILTNIDQPYITTCAGNGIQVGLISVIATLALMIFEKCILSSNLAVQDRDMALRFGALVIYGAAVITPLALGIIGFTGALMLTAGYMTSTYITHFQAEASS